MELPSVAVSHAACPGRAAALTVRHDEKTHPVVLPCRMLLHEALERFDLAAHPYFLLADDAGMLIGVLAPEEVAERIGSWNEHERKRWADMPLEGLLKTRMEAGHFLDGPNDPRPTVSTMTMNCTVLVEGGRLIGVMTSDDLLLSWRAAESTLRTALIDAVTQLPNRLVFHQRLSEEVERAQRIGHSIGVILVDVDHFKQINDEFGHASGDVVLQAVAKCLQSTMRSYDHVARFGGDEFAVICSGCRPGEIDLPLIRLQRAVDELRRTRGGVFENVTISVGAAVAHVPTVISQPQDLVDAADQGLYRAKANGRNCAFKRENFDGPLSAAAIVPLGSDCQPAEM
ncbi:MAG TPA: diguanylate cyclase, partial [Caulifigura sp.]|nr:diguanylate cyclase [Caulifigura sp.]